jgi:hypothetical protein
MDFEIFENVPMMRDTVRRIDGKIFKASPGCQENPVNNHRGREAK